MKIREEVEVKLSDEGVAKAIHDALQSEMTDHPINERSRMTGMELKGKRLAFKIEAKDLTALRAITDSKLRWLYAVSSCINTLKKWKNKTF